MKNDGKFKPGNPGKKPGTQNRLSRTVKETVLEVFNKLQEDPQNPNGLFNWAAKEPTEFYRIAAKLIPTEITGTVKQTIHITRKKKDADPTDGSGD